MHVGEYGNGRQENHYLILYFHLEINDVYIKKKHLLMPMLDQATAQKAYSIIKTDFETIV